jgi:hypothetical protein
MRSTRAVAVAAALACGATTVGACSGGGQSYCDVVRRLEVATDPLADQAIYRDPAKLGTALRDRVSVYRQLAAGAPAPRAPPPPRRRDAFVTVNDVLAAKGYASSAASDPAVRAVLDDPAVGAATDDLRADAASRCGSK